MAMLGKRCRPPSEVQLIRSIGYFVGASQPATVSRLQSWDYISDARLSRIPCPCSFQIDYVRQYDSNYQTEFVRQKSQRNTWPHIFPFAAQPHAQELYGWRKWYRVSSKKTQARGKKDISQGFLSRLVSKLTKLMGGIMVVAAMAIGGFPYFLSWPTGLDTVVYLINCNIPGTLSVESASLGWRKPLCLEGVTLKGSDRKVVLSIPTFKSSSHLWSLLTGNAGLGDTVIIAPMVDLRKDPTTGQPYLDLAISPIEKLQITNPYVKKNFNAIPPTVVPWTAKVRASGGYLEVLNGKVTLPGDVAAILGPSLFIDCAIGSRATKESHTLQEGKKSWLGCMPIHCSLSSDCAHLEGVAIWNLRKNRMELLQPIIAKMDLSPALAKFYLARINPLLGEIVGPAVGHEDLPDVTMYVTPADMVWPADEFLVRIEPMTVVLAKGQILDELLSLLSRRDLGRGNRCITVQTSAIEANIHLAGGLVCSRVDFLFADKVHVATWGIMDHLQETMKMVLGIPGTSLRDLLGLTKISPDYYLKIPIRGTFDRPQVDWAAAGRGITQLTIKQKLGNGLFSSLIEQFEDTDLVVPEPVGDLPWATN